jgi:hypothetical protein
LYFPKSLMVDARLYSNVTLMSQYLISSLPYPLNQDISSLYFTLRRKLLSSSDSWSTIPGCSHGDGIQLHIRGLKAGLFGGSGKASDQCKPRPTLAQPSSGRSFSASSHSHLLDVVAKEATAATLPALSAAVHMQVTAATVTIDSNSGVPFSRLGATDSPLDNSRDVAQLQSENQALKAELARLRSEAAANASAISREHDVKNKVLAAIKMLQSCDIAVEGPASGLPSVASVQGLHSTDSSASTSASGSAAEFNLKSHQSEQMVIFDVETTGGFGQVSAMVCEKTLRSHI